MNGSFIQEKKCLQPVQYSFVNSDEGAYLRENKETLDILPLNFIFNMLGGRLTYYVSKYFGQKEEIC